MAFNVTGLTNYVNEQNTDILHGLGRLRERHPGKQSCS